MFIFHSNNITLVKTEGSFRPWMLSSSSLTNTNNTIIIVFFSPLVALLPLPPGRVIDLSNLRATVHKVLGEQQVKYL